MSNPHLCIDARMIDASGIGRYLRNIIPGVIGKFPQASFFLIGDRDKLEKLPWVQSRQVKILHCLAPVYSIQEQFQIPFIPR